MRGQPRVYGTRPGIDRSAAGEKGSRMSDDPVIRDSPSPAAAAKRKPTALGRGLGALLGETRREEALVAAPGNGEDASGNVSEGLALLPVGAIEPHPEQPRRHF